MNLFAFFVFFLNLYLFLPIFAFDFHTTFKFQLTSVVHTRVPSNSFMEICEHNLFSLINTAMLANVCKSTEYISLVHEYGSFAMMFAFNEIVYLGIITSFVVNNVHFIMDFLDMLNVSEMLDELERK